MNLNMTQCPLQQPTYTRIDMPTPFVDCTFDDDVWYVRSSGKKLARLSWNRATLAHGENLSDAKHRDLLYAAKCFMLLSASSPAGRKHRSPRGSSLLALFITLRMFLQWMSHRSIYRFSELTIEHVIGYRAYIESERTSDQRRRGGRRKPPMKKRLASNTLFTRAQVVLFLVRLQVAMGDSGTHLNQHEVEDVFAAISGSAKPDSKTERIPDDLFRGLIGAALELLKRPVVNTLEIYMNEFEQSWQRKKLELSKQPPVKAENARYNGHFTRWCASKTDAPTITLDGKTVIDLSQLGIRDIKNLFCVIRGACLVVAAGLVGMRVSELRTLVVGCLRTRRLPNQRVLLAIHGTLYKTADDADGEDAEWVAGWNETANPVRLAIEALETLARLERTDALFPATEKGFVTQDRFVSRHSMPRLVQRFAAVVGRGDEWHFEMHQFRKTFARFVALSANNAPLALMRHFKHVSIQMTERYFPDDPELVGDIIEASESIVAERLDSVFGAERLGGIKGREIVAHNEAFRGDAHAKERRELVEMSLRDPTVRVLLHVYGICIYDEATARCRGDIANVGLWTCIDCPNSVMDDAVKPFWTEEITRLNDAIALRGQLGFVDLDLIRQREKAAIVLETLGDGNR